MRGLGADTAQRIVDERDRDGPYTAIDELTRRVRLTLPQVEALATAGALSPLEPARRAALWAAGAASRERPDALPGTAMVTSPPALPGMTAWELMAADVKFTGLSPDGHPVELLRAYLDSLDVLPTAALPGVEDGIRVLVGGAITHTQRPPTAGGVTFVNLEDETAWSTWSSRPVSSPNQAILLSSRAIIVRGIIQTGQGAISLVADQLTPLDLEARRKPRNFQWSERTDSPERVTSRSSAARHFHSRTLALRMHGVAAPR